MLKVDKRQLSSIKSESDVQGQINQNLRKQRRGSGGSNKKASQSSRKTPSPHKDMKVLQRRSPTSSVVGSPNAGTTGYRTPPSRNSPTRMLPKCKEAIEEKTATSLTQRALNFNDNLELLNSNTYAGARFHSPPTPDTLPKPPTHWMPATCATMNHMFNAPHLDSITTHLKCLLNVQA